MARRQWVRWSRGGIGFWVLGATGPSSRVTAASTLKWKPAIWRWLICAGSFVNLRLGGLVFGTNQATIREIREIDPTFPWRNNDIRAEHIIKDGPFPDAQVVDGFMFAECLDVLGERAVRAFRAYRAANPLA